MTYITNKDYLIEVGYGNVAGTQVIQQFGRNPDTDTATTPEDVWPPGGVWVPPTTGRIHDVVSDSASDTSAGTGAQTVLVKGLDASGNEQQETVTMNGVTNVPTSGTYTMIYAFTVATAGSGESNAGIITATAQTDATVTAHMAVGVNRASQAIYQIPTGKTALILGWYADVDGGSGQSSSAIFRLVSRPSGGVFEAISIISATTAGSSIFTFKFEAPQTYPAGTIIKVQTVLVDANNVGASAGFELLVTDD